MHEFSKLGFLQIWIIARRYIFPILILSAAISILIVGIFNSFSAHSLSTFTHNVVTSSDATTRIATSVVLMLVHASYLLIMAYHIIYGFPLERYPGWPPAVLALICIAYWLIAIHAGFRFHAVELSPNKASWLVASPYLLFGPAYILLAIHGIHECRGGEAQRRARVSKRYFLIIDSIFGILFMFFGFEALSQNQIGANSHEAGKSDLSSPAMISSKDILIVLVLVGYGAANKIVTILAGFHRNIDYEEYLKHTKLISPPGALADIGTTIGHGKLWLDYGSGTGHRIREMLELAFKPSTGAASKVLLYDTNITSMEISSDQDKEWFKSNAIPFEKAVPSPELVFRREAIRMADVVLLSHIVYNPFIGEEILQDLNVLKSGSFVVIRTTGSTGMFRVLSLMNSRRPFNPSFRHSVPQILLRQLQKELGFKLILNGSIKQVYSLSGGIPALCTWCDIRYGEGVGSLVMSYVNAVHASGISELPNDDDVHVLQKGLDATSFCS